MNTLHAAMLYVTCGLTITNFILLIKIWDRVKGEIEGEITINTKQPK